ncbi:MAG: sulfotransferase [Pseudomonadota bacterium]
MTTGTHGLRARDYHRRPLSVINTLLKGLNRVGLARVPLTEQDLRARAERATGLSDYGDDESTRAQLRVLLDSTERQAALTPTGRLLCRTNILRVLKHRLLLQDLLKKHPEILERSMPDPVVVVGLARSGTTRLHRMLAADERFLHLSSWESVNPVPWPESFEARERGEVDPRITNIDQALKAVLYMSPQIAAVHPLGTMEVEEEIGLIQHAFATQIFEVIGWAPDFAQYLEEHDQTFAYEYMVILLKVISWFRGDPEDKPWVLKSPQHMQDLDALMNVFPGARLIFPHRDPIKVVGSVCSTVWNSVVRDTENMTPDVVGHAWLPKVERMLHKTLKLRESIPAAQQHDVLYADISADWEATLQGVYDFLGMPFAEQARQGMRNFLAANAQHKHGLHKYALSDFGLDRDDVDNRLAFYRERYAIPYETRNPYQQADATEGD